MCMVSISDELVKEAVAAKAIDENYNEETLSKVVEDLLSEKIAQKRSLRLGMLKFRGSKVWEGELDEMRAKKSLSAENISEMLAVANPCDFGENSASIQRFRELTKNDVW